MTSKVCDQKLNANSIRPINHLLVFIVFFVFVFVEFTAAAVHGACTIAAAAPPFSRVRLSLVAPCGDPQSSPSPLAAIILLGCPTGAAILVVLVAFRGSHVVRWSPWRKEWE